MKLIEYISHLPHRMVVGFCLVCILLVGVIDYYIGPLVNLDFVYVIPIALLSWTVGFKKGLIGIGLMTIMNIHNRLIWIPVNSYPAGVLVWNTISDLLDFSLTTFLLSTLKERLDLLNDLAAEDYLTKLANRRSFYREVRREANRCRRNNNGFSMAYIDVDNFKSINDTLGHSAGDDLLIYFTKVLRQNTRVSDVVARLGGDEFAILFPATNSQQVQSAIQKILDRLNGGGDSANPICTCSIGAITFTAPMEELDDMITIADQLMYIAKKSGKNTACYAEFNPPNELRILD